MTSSLPPVIEGLWQMLRAELDAEIAPDLVAHRTEIELNAGTYIVRFDRQISDRGTYTVEHAGPVKTLVLRGEQGPNAGRTIPCIFQLTGNRLRVCYGLGGVFPTEFTTAAGQQRFLATYRRK